MSRPNPVNVSLTVDLSGLQKKFSPAALEHAQGVFAARVGFDSNAYVKYDTGDTHDSMGAASDYKKGDIVWDTDYAAYAYYDPHVIRTHNPLATDRWFEVAKEARIGSWRAYAIAALEGRG